MIPSMNDDGISNLPAKPPAERVFVSSVDRDQTRAEDIGQKFAGVARTGFGTLASTVRRMGWLAVALAIAAGYIAGQKSGTAGFLAVLLALGFTAVAGFVLAVQRAGLLATADGVRASGVASKAFNIVFDKLLGTSTSSSTPDAEHPDRVDLLTSSATASAFARTAGRVPLSQAQALLEDAIAAIPRAQFSGVVASLFHKAQQVAISTIRRLTLSRFRAEDAAGGGIDLAKVRDHLSAQVDDAVAAAIRRRVRWMTLGYVVVVIAAVLGAAWGLRTLFA